MLARPIFAINTEVLTNRGRMSTISSGTRKINAFNFRAIEIANFADIVGVTTSTRGYIYQVLTHHSVSFARKLNALIFLVPEDIVDIRPRLVSTSVFIAKIGRANMRSLDLNLCW